MAHRVLVVDDEEAVRGLVRDALEGRGYRVYVAAEFNQATKALKENKPQLVLIDFLLPKKNGFALAEAIRKDPDGHAMPIIMMSGVFKNPKTAVEAREKFQVIDFLSKPLDLDRLAALIQRTLKDVPEAEDEPQLPAVAEAPPLMNPPVAPRGEAGDMVLEMSGTHEAQKPAPRGLSYGGKSRSTQSMSPLAPAATQSSTERPSMAPRGTSKKASPARGSRPFPPMPEGGDLEQFPVALLISILRYDRLTGMLDLSANGTHRRVYVLRGQPIFMQSNADGENVGALLLRRGRITEPDFDRCLEYMKTKKRTLQQALLELRLATEHDLATAYKLLAGQLLPSAIGMPQGQYKWRETDAFVGRVPEGNFEPHSVLFEGIKRHVHPPQILRFFKGREDIPLQRTPEFETLLPFFRRAFSANNIAQVIDGQATYREITKARSAEAAAVVPQLFALVTSGMTVIPEIDSENMLDVAVNAAAAEVAGIGHHEASADDLEFVNNALPSDDGIYSGEEENARAKVLKGFDQIMSKNFFEIFSLRVDNDVNLTQLKESYFKLAKQWHGDAFAGIRLGSAKAQLDELFSRITEAYETLNDPGKRREYMTFLDLKAKGLPTDVHQIMRAEQVCDEALAAMRKRDYKGAARQMREAIQLNAGQAIYFAYLGWAIYLGDPGSPGAVTEAVQALKKAMTMQENLPVAYQYLGQIAVQREAFDEAKKWFARCLEWEPNNIEAQRGLRLVQSRNDQKGSQKSSGLLSRFLSKKN